jgi:hypothetical protein
MIAEAEPATVAHSLGWLTRSAASSGSLTYIADRTIFSTAGPDWCFPGSAFH